MWRQRASQVPRGRIAGRVLVKHYAPADCFVNGGRAPLLYNSFRFFEPSLDLCRAAAGQAYAQTTSWCTCLRLLVAETGWFLERADTLNGEPRFVSPL